MSHTPLPWRLDGDEIVSDATGEMLADFYDMHHGAGELGTDNAALAVHAVNCHDELLAALKAQYAAMPDCDGDHIMDAKGNHIAKAVGIGAAAKLARAAIAKAEGR